MRNDFETLLQRGSTNRRLNALEAADIDQQTNPYTNPSTRAHKGFQGGLGDVLELVDSMYPGMRWWDALGCC